MEVLNINSAMEMVDNDRELYKMLLDAYLDDTPMDEQTLRQLETGGDPVEAAKYVHRYKGSAKQLGAEKLGQAAQNLEDVLRGKCSGDVESLTVNLMDEYKTALDAMKKTRESL